jgi:PPM family protein phosphatase
MEFFRRLFANPQDDPAASQPAPVKPETPFNKEPAQTEPIAEPVSDQPVAPEEPSMNSDAPVEEDATKPLSGSSSNDNGSESVTESDVLGGAREPAATAPLPNSIVEGVTRPLPPERLTPSSDDHLTFGQTTDVGMVRTNNQDSVFSFFATGRSADSPPDFGVFIVADGMGGHHDGEKASALTARIVATYILNNIYVPILSGDNDSDRPPIIEAMTSAVQKANSETIRKVPQGGTTLTSAVIIDNLAHIVHVGDSRVYIISKEGGVEKISRDHSLVERLIEMDQITRSEAEEHPQRNVLYRAIGQNEHVEVDTLTRRLPPDSRLLLCSDGLWGQVEEADIRKIVLENEPQLACDKLVALANTRGGVDNITAIILKIPS